MTTAHNLGFPRIGLRRELKWALERYWKGEISQEELKAEGKRIRAANWAKQIDAGHDFLSVGDFSWYDHVLDTSALLGVIPERFGDIDQVDLDTYFRMARGRAPSGEDTFACEMTKWFDTNYHYIVPEFSHKQEFKVCYQQLFENISEAQLLGKSVKPILLGPLSFLWLGKAKYEGLDKLTLLKKLHCAYFEILTRLRDQGVTWVQIDEPILVLDLPLTWQEAFKQTYQQLQIDGLKLLLTTYFGGLGNNLELACQLPTAGLHIDVVRDDQQVHHVLNNLSSEKVLSIGLIDGRNIWKADLRQALNFLIPLHKKLGDRLWVGPSCPLLHCPVDLDLEEKLDTELKSWLAFSVQKLIEINRLKKGLEKGEKAIASELDESDRVMKSKKQSSRIHNPSVKNRCQEITAEMLSRQHRYPIRKKIQKSLLNLPLFPTTTIGSFPQTSEIRAARHDYKSNKLNKNAYQTIIRKQIASVVHEQLDLGIDVLVHGESERNDMVEYFGELLEGFVFTENGWVQSYGSRCVKPPIIFGDVSRNRPMTVEWTSYAQSQSDRPVKGMLTGPFTMLCWSFVRNDQSRYETAKQIALALRDEVDDLVRAGVQIIQIDEPAFREGLPLRQETWPEYLEAAVQSFRLASCSVPDHIQIHTHMCYAEFNDIMESIAELDADVITIETSRSAMELLKAFENFSYPNDIGPGVYDIHSPRVPTVEEIVALVDKAAKYIPVEQLWINPDCGLKTRDWSETKLALRNMITAAHILREKYTVDIQERVLD